MFKNVINSTPFTTEIANGYFTNIEAKETFRGDVSFISTLRALVAPRLSSDEKISLSFTSTRYRKRDSKKCDLYEIVGFYSLFENYDVKDMIQIHNFSGVSEEDIDFCMETVENNFESQYTCWHRLGKVTDFYRKSFKVLCYIDPEKKNVFIFTGGMTLQKMHYLQCSIFAFLPWYFNPEEGVSELEMRLIESLREKTSTKYMECLAEMANKYDFNTERVRKLLQGFELRHERQEAESIKEQIENCITKINNLNESIGAYLRTKSDMELRLLGIEAKIEQGVSNDSEIMEYFLCNKNIILDNVTNTVMKFTCISYLSFYDEEMAKKVIDNHTSFIYRPNGRACNNYIPENDMKKLMYALFIDEKLKMRVCASYSIDLRGGVSGLSHVTYSYECRDCMPNPHIDQYACMGNYTRVVNTILQEHNYIGAIEQCLASCKSLNFADSTVMKMFASRIYGLDGYETPRCIELPDGNVVTPLDAIKWLKENETQTQEGEVKTDE